MKLPAYRWQDGVRGLCIYAGGDSVAAAILGEFGWLRVAGMMAVGGLLYAWEIPAFYGWIDRVTHKGGRGGGLKRTLLATLFFNPLWIARHLAFVKLFSGRTGEIGWALLSTGCYSFVGSIPIALVGNYLIQVATPLRHRFLASAFFSALMVVYYAASSRWFS